MTMSNITKLVPVGTALLFYLPEQGKNHTAVQLATALIQTIHGTPPAGFEDVDALGSVRHFLGHNKTEKEIVTFLDGYQYLPKDRLYGQMIPGFVLLAVAGLFVALRLGSRWVLKKHWARWDDLCVLSAWIFSAAFVIAHNKKDMDNSVLLHVWNITLPQIKAILYMRFWTNFTYVLSLAFVKLSFLFLYYQISSNRGFRVLFWILTTIITLSSLSLFLINFFLCKPFDTWNHFLTVKCVDMAKVYTWGGTMNILTDVMIFVFPMPVVYSLHMDRREKFIALGLFSMGFLVCIASAVRLFTVKHFARYPDFTTAALPTMHLAEIETNLAIIVACLPSLRKLVQKLFMPEKPASTYEERSKRMGSTIASTTGEKGRSESQPEFVVKYNMNNNLPPHRVSAFYVSNISDEKLDGSDVLSPVHSTAPMVGTYYSDDEELQIVKTSRVSVHVDDPMSREMCNSPGCRRGSATDENEGTAEEQMQRDLEKGHNYCYGQLKRGETITTCVVGGQRY